jgi:hypothetical protein
MEISPPNEKQILLPVIKSNDQVTGTAAVTPRADLHTLSSLSAAALKPPALFVA